MGSTEKKREMKIKRTGSELKNLFCGRQEEKNGKEDKKTHKAEEEACAYNQQPTLVHKTKWQQANPRGTPLSTEWAGFDSQRVPFYQKRIHSVDC